MLPARKELQDIMAFLVALLLFILIAYLVWLLLVAIWPYLVVAVAVIIILNVWANSRQNRKSALNVTNDPAPCPSQNRRCLQVRQIHIAEGKNSHGYVTRI